MAKQSTRATETDFISAWFRPRTARVSDTMGSSVAFYLTSFILFAIAVLMYTRMGSIIGTVAAVAAAGLMAFRTKATVFETKLLYSFLIVIASVPVGRILEMYHLGALNLIIVVSAITFLFIGGRAK